LLQLFFKKIWFTKNFYAGNALPKKSSVCETTSYLYSPATFWAWRCLLISKGIEEFDKVFFGGKSYRNRHKAPEKNEKKDQSD